MTADYFTCPLCGGHHFGRRTVLSVEHGIVATDRVDCHDQRSVGCRWSGRWPLTDKSPKIYHELAEMRKFVKSIKENEDA